MSMTGLQLDNCHLVSVTLNVLWPQAVYTGGVAAAIKALILSPIRPEVEIRLQ